MPSGLALDLRVKPGTQAEVGPVDERARRRGLCLLRPSATARWFEEFRLHALLCLPELQPQIRERLLDGCPCILAATEDLAEELLAGALHRLPLLLRAMGEAVRLALGQAGRVDDDHPVDPSVDLARGLV